MASPSLLPTTALALGLSLVLPGLALAAPPDDPNVPAGTAGQDNASSGSTELGTGDAFQTTKEVGPEEEPAEGEEAGPDDPHADDLTSFDIQLGGIFNTGNSRNLSATGASNFTLRRTIHQVGASVAGNYGAADEDDDGRYDPNVGNFQGLARYDVFFAKRWTAFLQYTARHDTFQGLIYRMNISPGFAFYALNKPKHRLWFEAGYDFQYDIRTDEVRAQVDPDTGDTVLDMDGNVVLDPNIDKVFINHAARIFIGYSNNLSERVGFNTGLEYLQSVVQPEVFRFNYIAGLNTQLVERLSLALTFTLRYAHTPVPGVVDPDIARLDTISAVSLSYQFF